MPEEVDSAWQGAAALFYENEQLRAGGVRIAPSPDGKSIYYGSTTRGWQRPDEGIQRITYNGKTPFHIKSCSLTLDGFNVGFTEAIANPDQLSQHIKIRSYRFEYGYKYGSGELDQRDHKVLAIQKLDDSNNPTWGISVENLEPGRIYEL